MSKLKPSADVLASIPPLESPFGCEESMSVSIRPISNGYLKSIYKNGRHEETYSAEKPELEEKGESSRQNGLGSLREAMASLKE